MQISSREFAAEATPPVRIDPNSPRCAAIRCATANDLLIDLELRLGGGSRRLIGYGLVRAWTRARRRYTTTGSGLDVGRTVAATAGGLAFRMARSLAAMTAPVMW